MNWETVIGLETHVELATKSKIFCACTTAFGGAPNTHCCPVCTGMPGALPVLNGKVVEYAVRAAMALGCTVTRYSRFDRKNYFYPDLPKAYQISQLYLPIGRDGTVEVGGRTVGIHELHMEEDAGKLIHDPWTEQTKIDYNRCGVPLIEIVTEPDFRTAEEVVSYLEWLRETLQYLGVSDCKMQEGSLRCDVNLSVRPAGSDTLGTRTELKNLSSFKAIRRAIYYEARRQIERLEAGGRVVQETRRWDENKDASYPMRSKEDAQDYRYFPEPDLPPLELSEAYIQALRASQPELATAKRARYQAAWGLGPYDAEMLTSQKALARFFEETVALGAEPKQAANWLMGPVLAQLSAHGLEARDMALTPPPGPADPVGEGGAAQPQHRRQSVRGGLRDRRRRGRVCGRPRSGPGVRRGPGSPGGGAGALRQRKIRGRLPLRQGEGLRLPGGAGHAPAQGPGGPGGGASGAAGTAGGAITTCGPVKRPARTLFAPSAAASQITTKARYSRPAPVRPGAAPASPARGCPPAGSGRSGRDRPAGSGSARLHR